MIIYIVAQRYFFEEDPVQFIIRGVFQDKDAARKKIRELYDKEFSFYSREYGAENIGAYLETDWLEVKSETAGTFADIEEKELQ